MAKKEETIIKSLTALKSDGIMQETRCIHCGRYLFSSDVDGSFTIKIKCKNGCHETVYNFVKVTATITSYSIGQLV